MNDKDRLLHQIIPLEYNLLLKPDLEKFVFTGEETLVCTVKSPTKEISLHAHELVIKKAIILENGEEHIAEVSYNKKEKSITLHFSEEIQPGKKKIQLIFSGIIGEKLSGWYKSSYNVDGKKKYLATTQLEQIGAREVFPGIDDPMAKAVFRISLLIPNALTAISNSIEESVVKHNNGYKTVTFSPTPKMSTYILAFIVGEFEYIEKTTTSGVKVRVFVTPGKKSLAEFALDTSTKMLPFYEKYFDIAYPLPVLDLIAIPDFDAGAMENWGAITAREVALLVDDKQTSAANKQWVATVIAHELTHMWFGNLVTMHWWSDLWLNEGFASYMEYIGLNQFFPQWHVWEQFSILDHNRAMGLDSLENTHTIQADITDVERVSEFFDEVSYSKGASVIQMLAEYLGEKDFRDGLRHYLKKHAYANTKTEDLWESLEIVSGKKIKHIATTFTQKAGHPIITCVLQGNNLQLNQTRFFSSSLSRKRSNDTTTWAIPLENLFGEKKQTILFDTKTMVLPMLSSWVKLNIGETSFVRTIYSQELYSMLQKPLEEKILQKIDRMGILRDAFDGAESGYASTVAALDLVKNYRNEDAYIVWATLSGKLGKVKNLLESEKSEKLFQEYARELFKSIGKKVGWEKKSGESHDDILLRSVVLSSLGMYKDVGVIARAKELFTKVSENRNSVDTDIRGVVYTVTAENGGKKEFEILKNMYIAEDLAAEKNRIGNALCFFEDAHLVKQALEFSLSEYVRSQDIGRFLVMSFENKKGRQVAWEFIKTNWETLLRKLEGHSIEWILEGVASVTSESLAKDIKAFLSSHPHTKLEKTTRQVLEQMDSNLDWLERDRSAIEKFLTERV